MIDLCLVNPNNRTPAPFAAIEPPLWLGLIAGYHLAKGETVAVVDAETESLTVEQTKERVRGLCPQNTIIVVMGNNPSVSSTPKMPVAEELFKELIQTFTITGQRLQVQFTGLHPIALNYANTITKPFKGTPRIPWELLPMDKYRAHNWHCLADIDNRSPYGVLYTSLNCPFNCSYCNIHTLYNDHKVRYRPLPDIYADLHYFAKNGIRNIKIWDELFTLKQDRVHQICNYIIKQGYQFNIWTYARVDSVNDRLLAKMKRAGINWLCYGFESMYDPKMARTRTEEVIEMTRKAGINILANFLFGLPGETPEDRQNNLDFVIGHNFEYVNFYVALPYPGSAWYNSLKDKPTDWERFSQFSKNMYGDPEVIKFKDEAFQKYFNRPQYLSMIKSKFGDKAEQHILEMLKWKIR